MTDKLFSGWRIYQYYMPVALSMFMFITIERQVSIPDGGYNRLYGFPLPWISNGLGSSMGFQVYLIPMILNLLFLFGITFLIFAGIRKLGLKLKIHWALVALSTLIFMFYVFVLSVYLEESSFLFLNEFEYETTGRKFLFRF